MCGSLLLLPRLSYPDIGSSEALDYLGLVKLVNYVRSEERKGTQNVRLVIDDDSVFQDDRYLLPVLEDDALLYSLEDILESDSSDRQAVDRPLANGLSEDKTVARVVELEEELRRLQQQFKDYKETVDKTLESRWNSSDSNDGPSRAAENHNESKHEDTDYFKSYSYNGEEGPKVHSEAC